MRNSFSTILWDVDGTLLDFTYSQRFAITKCFKTIGREITEEQIKLYARINDEYWKRLELGEVTKEQLLTGRFLTLFSKLQIEGVDAEAFRLEYQDALGNVYAYIEDSLDICRALRKHVKQYVITNGVSSTQRNKLRLSGFAEIMDGIFISEEIGCHKPQRVFFDYCLEHIEEKDKSRILIVGDSLSSDIKGGIQAGIPTCWFHADKSRNILNHKGNGCNADSVSNADSESNAENEDNTDWLNAGGKSSCKPDYVISSLHMIYDILGVLNNGKVGGTKAEAAVHNQASHG